MSDWRELGRTMRACVTISPSLEPADLNTVKPSEFNNDKIKWRQALERACSCLADKGYDARPPTNAEAAKLLDKTISHSLSYIIKLAKQNARLSGAALAAGVAVVVLGTALATAFLYGRRRGREEHQ